MLDFGGCNVTLWGCNVAPSHHSWTPGPLGISARSIYLPSAPLIVSSLFFLWIFMMPVDQGCALVLLFTSKLDLEENAVWLFMKQTWVRAHPDLFNVTRSRSHKMCETLLIVDGWKLSSKFSHGHVPCFDSQLLLHCSYGVHCFCASVELSIVPLTCLSWHGKGSH